jgi:methionyl-tRNA formyltransferase
MAGDTRIKVMTSRVDEAGAAPGTVLLDPLRVACGTGSVALLSLQRAGKAVQPARDFLNGWSVSAGTTL